MEQFVSVVYLLSAPIIYLSPLRALYSYSMFLLNLDQIKASLCAVQK